MGDLILGKVTPLVPRMFVIGVEEQDISGLFLTRTSTQCNTEIYTTFSIP